MYQNKLTANAIKVISIASKICSRLKSKEMQIEHLFLGILLVNSGLAAKLLESMGVDLIGTAENMLLKLGWANEVHQSTTSLDNEAEPEVVREGVEVLSAKTNSGDDQLPKNLQTNVLISEVLGERTEGSASSENEKLDLQNIKVSIEVKNVLDLAFNHAIELGHTYVGTEHLLLGILSIKGNAFVEKLYKDGLSVDEVRKQIEKASYVSDSSINSSVENMKLSNVIGGKESEGRDSSSSHNNEYRQPSSKHSSNFLENWGRNLTEEAKKGKLDPVIGRDKEIDRIMQILARRRKNNPILLGDAGVGKTAIVEGLAQKLILPDVSPILANFEIWAIDTALLLAGSQLRGDLESRTLDLIREVERRGNVILFIDEIHTIVGAGSTTNNPMDLGNILKPALAKGSLRCIGATTVDEYKKYFDEDPALQRRFQPVEIDELSEEQTYEVLKQLKSTYEKYHDVKISNAALKAAIRLSARYITDRYLPDKAIDLIDEACARNKLSRIRLSDEFRDTVERLKDVINKKNEALAQKEIEKALSFLEEENVIKLRLREIEEELRRSWASLENKTITSNDIRSIVASWTKISLVDYNDVPISEQINKLEKDLRENIIGQEYAINVVVDAIKRAKTGLSGFDKPLASFLFIGPTGVGKTEMAKQLAKSLFGSKDALIQVDMSELMERHSVSKLIGAPPGYVGFDKGGQLTDKVRRNPFSVILFDEIEKADQDVLNILLQILDEGKLTDSKGRVVNFKNTIIIMTSNMGADILVKDSKIGINVGKASSKGSLKLSKEVYSLKEKVIEELKEHLTPEFINRIDDIVVFKKLSKKDVADIVKLQIKKLVDRLRVENGVYLHNADSESIVKYIVKLGYSKEYGARELSRIVQSYLVSKLADVLINLKWNPDRRKFIHINVKLYKNTIKLEPLVSEKLEITK